MSTLSRRDTSDLTVSDWNAGFNATTLARETNFEKRAAKYWTRPSYWPPLPAVTMSNTTSSDFNKFYGVMRLASTGANLATFYASMTVGTTYTIDWGDGNTETAASDTVITHTYDFSTVTTDYVDSEGQKYVLVSAYTSGTDQFVVNIGRRPSSYNTAIFSNSGWCDVVANTNLTTYDSSYGVYHGSLERVQGRNLYLGASSATVTGMYPRLTVAYYWTGWNSAALTATNKFAYLVPNLRYIHFDGNAVWGSCSNMFRGCTQLREIYWGATTFGTTAFDSAFSGCSSLETVHIPGASANASTNSVAGMFTSCNSLKTVTADKAWVFANSTAIGSMFSGCNALRDISGLSIASADAAPTTVGTFGSCYALTSLPSMNLDRVTAPTIFSNNYSLETINLSLSSATSTSIFTGNMYSLRSAIVTGLKMTSSFANSIMQASALDALYTSLADIKSYTGVTATGNGTTHTYTTTVDHYMVVGQRVTVTGMVSAGFNVTNAKVTAVTARTFTTAGNVNGSSTQAGSVSAAAAATITVTNNPGTASDNPTIATNKGWTVTG